MTNIDAATAPAVATLPKCENPKVDLEVEKPLLTLKHDNRNRLKIVITPASCRGTAFRIEIKKASGGGWAKLSKSKSFLWKATVAGKFKLRGIATIEGSEVQSGEKDVEVQFPTYAQIIGDPVVQTALKREWVATLRDCTKRRRRERGFHIRVDTTASPNRYIFTNPGRRFWVRNSEGARLGLGGGRRHNDDPMNPAPTDKGSKYVVASFHTHTSTEFRNVGRPIGPSGADNSNNSSRQVPGVVYDYVDFPLGSGNIPAGHPKASAAMLYYSAGVNRRPTP